MVIEALGNMEAAEATTAITLALKDADPAVRKAADTRYNTAWALVRGDSIGIQTPDPWIQPGCHYLGTITDNHTRMGGRVTCTGGPWSPPGMIYRGTWEGHRTP